ncbi:MAG: TFIIB-type zinc ribbon-containing protein [Eubacteriales bacterium]
MEENINIIDTAEGAKDGRMKCPKCGSSDISPNINTTKLRCNFCRHEFEASGVEDAEIFSLEGLSIGSGATDIVEDAQDVVTLKCDGCGAEVVIDTASSTSARCHWCRSTLSVNSQIPNGAVPDALLPFSISKKDAEVEIAKFVNKRKFFAHPKFTKEFNAGNICGVYLPYMVLDVNAHMQMSGVGEILVKSYKGNSDDDDKTYYDADAYYVERDFDIGVDDLTIEASVDKLNVNSKEKTTNIINSIMPFDTENRVKYNSNYLKGFTSEKRDINIDQIRGIAHKQAEDVARLSVRDNITDYNRGVSWGKSDFNIKGESWKSMYLPVWLYSYMQNSKGKKILHYVAVNARTKETMGSVPVNLTKLCLISILIEFLATLLMLFLGSDMIELSEESRNARWALLLSGIGFFIFTYARYRNSDKRHMHETETKYEVKNLKKKDEFKEHRYGLKKALVEGENTYQIDGDLRSNT